MSDYVKLMEARKIALRRGDEVEAMKLFGKAMELKRAGLVTEKEMLAAAYI